MPNFSRLTLARIGRLLNGDHAAEEGKPTADLAKLAEWTATGRKAIYNWTLPEDDAQYRAMPPVVKRMVAMVAYFGILGQLNDQRLKDIEALEAALADDKQFAKLAWRFSMMLKAQAADAGKATEAAAAEHPGEQEAA